MAVVKPNAFVIGDTPTYPAANPHVGPTSYVRVTTGPLAGGDSCSTTEFGIKYFAKVEGGITTDGLYQVTPINSGGPSKTCRLRWVVLATGVEVANGFNLSGSSVMMAALGF